jgi:hypothetical protein
MMSWGRKMALQMQPRKRHVFMLQTATYHGSIFGFCGCSEAKPIRHVRGSGTALGPDAVVHTNGRQRPGNMYASYRQRSTPDKPQRAARLACRLGCGEGQGCSIDPCPVPARLIARILLVCLLASFLLPVFRARAFVSQCRSFGDY